DLEARTIREAAPAALDDDPARMIRAVRLEATRPGLTILETLAGRIRERAGSIVAVAPERVQMELDQILRAPAAGAALRRMADLGLPLPLFPELIPLRGLRQPPRHHDHDALEHTLRAVEEADRVARGLPEIGVPALAPDEGATLRWAALLHDVGKPATATV